MIIQETFKPAEIFSELSSERDDIQDKYHRYLEANISKIKKYVRSLPDSAFPYNSSIKPYKSRNNNQWYVYLTINNKRDFLKDLGYFMTPFCVVDTKKGKYVYVVADKPSGKGRTVRCYSPHYLKRYRERAIATTELLSVQEIMVEYWKVNASGINRKYSDDIRRQFDDSEIVDVLHDGVGLGRQLIPDMLLMETYVHWDMLYPNQLEVFQELKKEREHWDELINGEYFQYGVATAPNKLAQRYTKQIKCRSNG